MDEPRWRIWSTIKSFPLRPRRLIAQTLPLPVRLATCDSKIKKTESRRSSLPRSATCCTTDRVVSRRHSTQTSGWCTSRRLRQRSKWRRCASQVDSRWLARMRQRKMKKFKSAINNWTSRRKKKTIGANQVVPKTPTSTKSCSNRRLSKGSGTGSTVLMTS